MFESIEEARRRVQLVDSTRKRELAEAFARRAYAHGEVSEVWLTRCEDELLVTVTTTARDMELDLQLQREFIAVSAEYGSTNRWVLETRVAGTTEEDGELLEVTDDTHHDLGGD